MFNKLGLIVLVLVLAVFFCGKSNGDDSVSPASPLQSADELAGQTFVVFYYGYVELTHLVRHSHKPHFRRVNESDRYLITDLYRLLENPNFDSCKISAFYAHGNGGTQTNPRTKAIIRAYRKRPHSHNCLTLDWEVPAYANGNYTIAVYNAAVVSIQFIDTISIRYGLFQFNFQLDRRIDCTYFFGLVERWQTV